MSAGRRCATTQHKGGAVSAGSKTARAAALRAYIEAMAAPQRAYDEAMAAFEAALTAPPSC